MPNKTEKPYVLRAAEFVYSNIIEIKKQNPEINNIDDFKSEDIQIVDYEHHPHISAPISI